MRSSHTAQWEFINWLVKKTIHSANHKKLLAVLKQVRIEAGLRQADLARLLQKDQTFVSKYETGERRLDILEVRDICKALGMSLIEFTKRLEQSLK
jgi:transcriptional regulator with XRE-family HTH domain